MALDLRRVRSAVRQESAPTPTAVAQNRAPAEESHGCFPLLVTVVGIAVLSPFFSHVNPPRPTPPTVQAESPPVMRHDVSQWALLTDPPEQAAVAAASEDRGAPTNDVADPVAESVVPEPLVFGTDTAAAERGPATPAQAPEPAPAPEPDRSRLPDDTASDGTSSAVIVAPSANGVGARVTQPKYPHSALRARREGTVTLRLWVSASGEVEIAQIEESSGTAALDRAAIDEARRRWRLAPGTLNGVPAPMWHSIRVTFRLSD